MQAIDSIQNFDELILRGRALAPHHVSDFEGDQINRLENSLFPIILSRFGRHEGYGQQRVDELIKILENVLTGNLVYLGSKNAYLSIILGVFSFDILLAENCLQVIVLLFE